MLRLSISLVAVYGACLAGLYLFQRDLMFAPSTQRVSPAEAGFPEIEEVALTTPDGWELFSWYARAEPGGRVVLFLHGNAGSVGARGFLAARFEAEGFGVFLVGYPGYGGSGGEPSERSLVEAATLSYDALRERGVAASDIVIWGQSLGSAVAVQLAQKRPAAALVLVSPMSSAREIASAHYPFVPVRWLLEDPFLSIEHIRDLDVPLLVLHGDEDRIIPIASGRRLFAAAGGPKTFHAIPGRGHNDLYEFPIVPALSAFLESLTATRSDY